MWWSRRVKQSICATVVSKSRRTGASKVQFNDRMPNMYALKQLKRMRRGREPFENMQSRQYQGVMVVDIVQLRTTADIVDRLLVSCDRRMTSDKMKASKRSVSLQLQLPLNHPLSRSIDLAALQICTIGMKRYTTHTVAAVEKLSHSLGPPARCLLRRSSPVQRLRGMSNITLAFQSEGSPNILSLAHLRGSHNASL
ncbi:hypothetical protein BDN70DRAFT_243521 [Pholiota conissans]|uniref:Uncharacterized protein n=1 Tax=Pholiota conissans TaxID=109636 RepID=A0A9P5ZC97_9AGAR|nr:hypothetical protein BDN70DRAFT_243521 [Pholiota conissans]